MRSRTFWTSLARAAAPSTTWTSRGVALSRRRRSCRELLRRAVLCQLMRLNNHGVKIPRMMIDDWKPESECSHAYCSGGMLSKSMVEGYGLRFMFTNCLPSTIICMLMMDHVIGEKLPEMRVVLRGDQDEITPQMF